MLKRNKKYLPIARFIFQELLPSLKFTFRWLSISIVIGVAVGSASAFFLIALDWATRYREANSWLIGLLPFGGFFIGWMYYRFGSSVVKGNNQLLEEFYNPLQVIPLRMAPWFLEERY